MSDKVVAAMLDELTTEAKESCSNMVAMTSHAKRLKFPEFYLHANDLVSPIIS